MLSNNAKNLLEEKDWVQLPPVIAALRGYVLLWYVLVIFLNSVFARR